MHGCYEYNFQISLTISKMLNDRCQLPLNNTDLKNVLTPCFGEQKTAWLFRTKNLLEIGVKMTNKVGS